VPGNPPSPILLSALTSIVSNPAKGIHGYGLIPGEISLRKALADEMRRIYRHDEVEVDVNTEDVVITAGCNLAFVASILTLADAGDKVILPVPW
jgi:aspartate/methionine/tyrosine aminotransferase